MRRDGTVGVYVAVAIVGLVVLLPGIYFLSLGPAVRLAHHELLSESAVETVYFPLVYVAENCDPVAHALEMYVELWEPPISSSSIAMPVVAPQSLAPMPP